jgi:hypothetical protein
MSGICPSVRVFDELAVGTHQKRSVLLQHAKDRAGAGASIEPQHHRRVLAGSCPAERCCCLREPVVEVCASAGIEEAAEVRRRWRAEIGERGYAIRGRGARRQPEGGAEHGGGVEEGPSSDDGHPSRLVAVRAHGTRVRLPLFPTTS